MTVIDLIIALQNVDPNLEVVKDMTKNGSEFWRLEYVEGVEEIELSTGGKVIMLHKGLEFDDL